MGSFKDFLYKKAFDIVSKKWKKSKFKAILWGLFFLLIYAVVFTLIGFFVYFLQLSFPNWIDIYKIRTESGVLVSFPNTINETNEGLIDYQFRVSSKLNNPIPYIVDINIYPDYQYTIINKENSGLLQTRGESKEHNFQLEYIGRTRYTVEVIVKCGKDYKKICGRGYR